MMAEVRKKTDSSEDYNKQDGNSKSSDEYQVIERILIHPMTSMSKVEILSHRMNIR
jgi:hypothetical protein